jgi:hypothetical protein
MKIIKFSAYGIVIVLCYFFTLDIDFTIKFKLDHVVWTAELLVNSSKVYQDLSKELKTAVSTNI